MTERRDIPSSAAGNAAKTGDRERELTLLGYAGLIPFVLGAATVLACRFAGENALAETAAQIVIAYGGIIAAYMAGMGAGAAIAPGAPLSREPLLLTMLAALAAWVGLSGMGSSPAFWRPLVLAIVFCALLRRDLGATGRGEFPVWYGPLRWRLTIGAVSSLFIVAIGLVGFPRA